MTLLRRNEVTQRNRGRKVKVASGTAPARRGIVSRTDLPPRFLLLMLLLSAIVLFVGSVALKSLFLGQNDPEVWIPAELISSFDVSLSNSPSCDLIVSDQNTLVDIGRTAAKEWLANSEGKLSGLRSSVAASKWQQAMEACHGPLPPVRSSSAPGPAPLRLSLESWMEDLVRCGDPTKINNMGCRWDDDAIEVLQTRSSEKIGDLFAEMARCALHLEFPLHPPPPWDRYFAQEPIQARMGSTWKAKRSIILSLTVGPKGAAGGCTIIETGMSRGWEVVMVEGFNTFDWSTFKRRKFGIQHKYSAALRALDLALASSTVSDTDTLVVFADSYDVLVQQSPHHVADMFTRQPFQFVWSAEPNCFPMGTWPFDLGGGACDLFPQPPSGRYGEGSPWPEPLRPGERQFVNTGGWIGTASVAKVVLAEMSRLVARGYHTSLSRCHAKGTDQLLGNAALLRHPSKFGIDATSTFFASSPADLLNKGRLKLGKTAKLDHAAYCYGMSSMGGNGSEDGAIKRSDMLCPSFLHFNGGGGEKWFPRTMENLLADYRKRQLCTNGTLTIVNIDTGKILKNVESIAKDRWPCGADSWHRNCLKT